MSKKAQKDLLKEFMLEENQREVLKKVGKYSIYDINDEVEEILTNFTKMLYEDGNDKRVREITNSDEFMVKILGMMTDLPKEVLELKNYKMIKANQKKLFRDICFEVSDVISDYIKLYTRRMMNIANVLEQLDDDSKVKYLEKLTEKND